MTGKKKMNLMKRISSEICRFSFIMKNWNKVNMEIAKSSQIWNMRTMILYRICGEKEPVSKEDNQYKF